MMIEVTGVASSRAVAQILLCNKKLSTKKLKSAIMGENPKEDRTHP